MFLFALWMWWCQCYTEEQLVDQLADTYEQAAVIGRLVRTKMPSDLIDSLHGPKEGKEGNIFKKVYLTF